MSVMEEAIYHCRTQMKTKQLSYIWNIDNFWDILEHKYISNILFTKRNGGYLQLSIKIKHLEDKLEFYATTNNEIPIKSSYSIFLKTFTDEQLLASSSNVFHKGYFKLLYQINISTFKNEKKIYTINTLTLHFNFNIYEGIRNKSISFSHNSRQMMDEEELIPEKSLEYEDITFLINGKELRINKALICSQSKYFEDMCKENINCKIEITNVTYDTFQDLLDYVASGYLSKKLEKDVTMLCELFVTADTYDIKNLKLVCEQYIINNISITNVARILEIAHLHNGDILKKYAEDFIQLYFKDVVRTKEFKILKKKFPNLLIEIQNVYMYKYLDLFN